MMLVIEIVKLTITRTNPKMIPEIDVQQKLKFKAISWGWERDHLQKLFIYKIASYYKANDGDGLRRQG